MSVLQLANTPDKVAVRIACSEDVGPIQLFLVSICLYQSTWPMKS